jgi:hypothetical protein
MEERMKKKLKIWGWGWVGGWKRKNAILLFFIIMVSGVRLSPLGTAATIGLLYQPQMIHGGDCGTIGGMKIGRGNQSTWRKPASVPLSPPQIPHDLTQTAAVGK